MKKGFMINFILPFILGFMIWFCSPGITGQIKPWESGEFYYLISLCLTGFITAFLNANNVFLIYLGVILSQAIFIAIVVGVSELYLVRLGFVCLFSLMTLCTHLLVSLTKKSLHGK
jgi:hypothetical protein